MKASGLRVLLFLYFFSQGFHTFSQGADFGDCPDPPYPTLIMNNGAHHLLLPGGVFLGAVIDGEANGQVNAGLASGDDFNGDDEDGVILNSWIIPGMQASVKIIASTVSFLDAWIDFNGNGSWNDPGDQIFTSQPLQSGYNLLFYNVPANALHGLMTYARFRNSSMGGLSFTGGVPDGEVEDYFVFIGIPFPNYTLIDPDPARVFTQNEVSLTLVPGPLFTQPQVLLAAYNDEPSTGTPGIGISYSTNGGATWSNTQLPLQLNPITQSLFVDAFDPATQSDAAGNVYVAYISTDNNWFAGPASGLFVHRSSDYGVTWPVVTAVSVDSNAKNPATDPLYKLNDRDQMACDKYPQSPYYNRVYIAWVRDRGWSMSQPFSDIWFSYSSDAGMSFSQPVQVNDMNNNLANMPVPDVANDGTIYIAWVHYDVTTGGKGVLFLDKSYNGGQTWGTDIYIDTINLPPINLNSYQDARAKGATVLRVRPDDPNEVFLVYAADPDGTGPDEADIYFIKTLDAGANWTSPYRLNTDATTNDQVLPWMDISPDGVITIAWYDRRTDPMDLLWDVYYTTSNDYGNTFSPQLKVNTTAFSTPSTLKWGKWFGEYMGVVSDYNRSYVVHTFSAFDALGDVAFASALKPSLNRDYGDAPDAGFRTMAYSKGASHTLDGVTFLGAAVDSEPDGIPGVFATGDDLFGQNDEDGIFFPSEMFAGTSVNLIVTASVSGYLNGWVDFNGNGNWSENREYALQRMLLNPGINTVMLSIPDDAFIGKVYARFRFSSVQGQTASFGNLPDGEVEDYYIEIRSNTDISQQENVNNCELLIRPNPSSQDAVISFQSRIPTGYALRILSLDGKVLGKIESVSASGLNEIHSKDLFFSNAYPEPGIYIVEVCIGNLYCCKAKMAVLK